MYKKYFLISILLVFFNCVQAQEAPVVEYPIDTAYSIEDEDDDTESTSTFATEVAGDTSISYNGFEINKDTLRYLKNDKSYAWSKNIDSFLLAAKKQSQKEQKITIPESSGSSFFANLFNSGILKVILWAGATAFLLFIIYKLFLSEGLFSKRSKKQQVDIIVDEEDVDLSNDYDFLLRKAYNAGELKPAMRFLFLKTLQKLNEREMIRYAVDKTNSAYAREIPPAKRNAFASLALYYEYIWYGNAPVNKNMFDAIELKFNEFLNKI